MYSTEAIIDDSIYDEESEESDSSLHSEENDMESVVWSEDDFREIECSDDPDSTMYDNSSSSSRISTDIDDSNIPDYDQVSVESEEADVEYEQGEENEMESFDWSDEYSREIESYDGQNSTMYDSSSLSSRISTATEDLNIQDFDELSEEDGEEKEEFEEGGRESFVLSQFDEPEYLDSMMNGSSSSLSEISTITISGNTIVSDSEEDEYDFQSQDPVNYQEDEDLESEVWSEDDLSRETEASSDSQDSILHDSSSSSSLDISNTTENSNIAAFEENQDFFEDMKKTSTEKNSIKTDGNQLCKLDDDSRLCKICFDQQANCALVGCGHVVACHQCVSQLNNCPICRAKINSTIKIYFS